MDISGVAETQTEEVNKNVTNCSSDDNHNDGDDDGDDDENDTVSEISGMSDVSLTGTGRWHPVSRKYSANRLFITRNENTPFPSKMVHTAFSRRNFTNVDGILKRF